MKNIESFKKYNLKFSRVNTIFGGFKDIKTAFEGDDKKNPKYSDVFHDNDNDGKWSSGDSFEIKMNY